ncbi:MAG TPA: hypothetical protein VM468_17040 [Mycoplana sp.]|nr:hypothetical protein [Mycoplana sp.]
MNEKDRLEVVSRLNALRRLMINALAVMAGEERGRAQLEHLLEEIESVQDQEEDPGIDPSLAFTIQTKTDGEMKSILSAALERARSSS